MKQHITVGVACIARKTFDYQAAQALYEKIQTDLQTIRAITWEFVPDLVIERNDAQDAAKKLFSKHIDAFVCISGTFALGHLILEFNKILKCPILLWGLNELPYDGGKIRLNSVCGVNLNASNLYKAGVRDYHVVIGDNIDQDWLDAIRILKKLATARIGIIGYRAKGFFNLDVDELDLYNKIGVLIDHYELEELFETEVVPNDVEERKNEIQQLFDISKLSVVQQEKVAQLVVKFDNFMKQHQLTTLAVRCWPEFANKYGISPCAAMSVLQAENKILTCEGDILGSISMLAHQAIGARTPFLADFSQVNFEQNFALLWHCGVAPYNLHDDKCIRSLETYFAGGKGVTADFVMKEGDISLMRFDYAPPDEYRIFLQQAKAIPMKKELRGTYAKVVFENGVENVLRKVIDNGIAHHISLVYGSSFIQPFKIFAKLKRWSVVQ